MKTEEDEAFDELAKRQGAWGGGFKAKKAMAADKYSDIVSDGGLDPRNKMDAQPAQEPVREALKLALDALEESQTDNDTMEFWDRKSKAITAIQAVLAQPSQLAHILQFMKELRPAIGPMATMGKSKTTQEWFDIVINEIERLQAAQEKNSG